jgi:DNA primase large subunit
MDALERYINRVAYKFPKGYPDVNDPKDMEMLMEMVNSLVKEEEEKKEEELTVQTVKDLLETLDRDWETFWEFISYSVDISF